MCRTTPWFVVCAALACACSKDEGAQGRERVDERGTESTGSASAQVDPADEGPVGKRLVVDILMEASARLHTSFFVQRETSRSVRCGELEIAKHPTADRLLAALTGIGFDVTTTEHGWMIDGGVADLPRGCDGSTIAVIDRGAITEAARARRGGPKRKPLPTPTRESAVSEEDALAAVKELAPEEFEVGPNAVDFLRFKSLARPRMMVGEEGVRLFGIRNSGLLGALGLKNGDVLVSFNDVRLDDEEKVSQFLFDASIPAPSKIRLQVLRRGSSVELRYTVLPGSPTPSVVVTPTGSAAPSAEPLPPPGPRRRPRTPRPSIPATP